MIGTGTKPPAYPSAIVAARYEALRSAALGEPLAPEARSGMYVFLSRGMWAWTRIIAAGSVPLQTIPARSPAPPEPLEHRAVVHVLAAMAMTINDRRAA
jgi:hypothetical protein